MSVHVSRTSRPKAHPAALRRLRISLRAPVPPAVEISAVALGPFGALSRNHLVESSRPSSPDGSLTLLPAGAANPAPGLAIALDRLDEAAWAVAVVVAVVGRHPAGTVVVVVHDDDDLIGEIVLRELGTENVAVLTIASRDYDDWELAPERVEYAVDVTQALASIGVQTHDDGGPE